MECVNDRNGRGRRPCRRLPPVRAHRSALPPAVQRRDGWPQRRTRAVTGLTRARQGSALDGRWGCGACPTLPGARARAPRPLGRPLSVTVSAPTSGCLIRSESRALHRGPAPGLLAARRTCVPSRAGTVRARQPPAGRACPRGPPATPGNAYVLRSRARTCRHTRAPAPPSSRHRPCPIRATPRRCPAPGRFPGRSDDDPRPPPPPHGARRHRRATVAGRPGPRARHVSTAATRRPPDSRATIRSPPPRSARLRRWRPSSQPSSSPPRRCPPGAAGNGDVCSTVRPPPVRCGA